MTGWRLFLSALLILLIGLPVLLPLVECFQLGHLSYLETDADYLMQLARNTLFLIGGTLALALPVGTFLAVLLFRTDLPWRRFWIVGTLMVLFVPLPMLMAAWTALFGIDGWWPIAGWRLNQSQAWTIGLYPAVWVHGLAGIPWVVLIVGNGLCWIERELEEDALLHVGPWSVLWQVTLPRCRGSLAAAALWLSLATFAEIGITNYLQLPTLAEEVQTQFSSGTREALARSVLLSLPIVLAISGLLLWLTPRLENLLPPLQGWLAPPRPFPLGSARWPLAWLLAGFAAVLVLTPLASLMWQVGLAGSPRAWSLHQAWARLGSDSRVVLPLVLQTFATAGAAAFITSGLGLMTCWLARDSRWFRGLVLVLMVFVWSLPGPVIGIGLKETVNAIMDVLEKMHVPIEPVKMLLYDGPSPLPVMWAQTVRFLPVATALLWPWVRTVPRELLESARLEGARPLQEMTAVIWPLVARGFGWTFLIIAALCLSEVAASNRVETPGWKTFANVLFDRMHYRFASPIAAMCLILLGCLLALFGLGMLCRACLRRILRPGAW